MGLPEVASGAVLGLECAGPWCAVAVVVPGAVRLRERAVSTGQAEILMPMAEDVLVAAGLRWDDLTAVGVGIGPGNFTGLRIAVAAARGLALALDVPAVGVGLAEGRRLGLPGEVWVLEPGPADQVLVTPPDGPARLMTPEAASTCIGSAPITGPGAARLARPASALPAAVPLAEAVARIAATRARHGPQPRPAPLYLRPPDAAPSREIAPVLLD